jgi:hypothetical protein
MATQRESDQYPHDTGDQGHLLDDRSRAVVGGVRQADPRVDQDRAGT